LENTSCMAIDKSIHWSYLVTKIWQYLCMPFTTWIHSLLTLNFWWTIIRLSSINIWFQRLLLCHYRVISPCINGLHILWMWHFYCCFLLFGNLSIGDWQLTSWWISNDGLIHLDCLHDFTRLLFTLIVFLRVVWRLKLAKRILIIIGKP